ncbi:uncharacterized protein C8Q71DRAFT_755626 [Rhodofomes roseus]|uniref:N-acetyltransferase domain-containing protein n=1 Tax=Rhodofomes roseus TaxID=34475 RepID=A0ABQ8KJ39_9APHY|nr:uncharacterized protein C8Q71DRAFT_755626 [Rhodofomes roseus]KAH9838019.1 hypothetical protein C8Q71DRAFT_755626 [Rhodofomes roseus]
MQEQAGLTTFPDAKGAPERELLSEPQRHFNGLGRLRITIYRVGFQVQRDLRNQFEPWLRYYKAKIETTDGRQVAQLTYRVVNGNYVEDFQEDLQMSEYGGQELEEIFTLLYEKDGRLRDQWMAGEDAGTKIFGPEISAKATKVAVLACVDKDPRGDFLMVHEEFRRNKIGQWALHALFQLLRDEGVKVVLTRPSVPRLESSYKDTYVEGLLVRRNLAFTRKAGFRRVGASPVFAYMPVDPEHPSRQLPADRDAVSFLYT